MSRAPGHFWVVCDEPYEVGPIRSHDEAERKAVELDTAKLCRHPHRVVER